jgi:CRP/FNR family cyclic AMP-dependent transcriptional regulator
MGMTILTNSPLEIEGLEMLGAGTSFTEEICAMLSKVPIFDDLTRAELNILASFLHAFRAPKKTVILKEGGRTVYLFLVLEGSVSVHKEDKDGKQKLIAKIMPGKSFGEMSLLDDLPCSATITTEAETRVLLISRECFRRMIELNPALGVRLLWKLARLISLRLRRTSSQLVDLLE